MIDSVSRRRFLKIGAMGAGTLAIAPAAFRRDPSATSVFPVQPDDVIRKIPTFCEICFWKCAGWTYTKNGEPWKIIGNEEDLHSNGRFCTRGTAGLGSYTDSDRLRHPLLRRERDGEQAFEEVSWDEALGFIAEKLTRVKQEYGPESLAMFSHGSGATHWKTLTHAFGSENITAPSYAQCRGPRDDAFGLTFGEGVGSPERTDIQSTRCLVLIGSHIGENLHNGQVQEMAKAIERKAEIIVVDPRFSVAAGKAKHWLPIKPSTDLALLLAWTNVILEEELFDHDYVARYTLGLDELRTAVASNTPEWAYPITTIRPEVIRETARTMARHAPATLVHPGRHVTWYGDDTQRSRAIAILNTLLGSWGREGGFYFQQKAHVPGWEHPPFPVPAWDWRDLAPNSFPFASSAIATLVRDATADPEMAPDKPIKAWLVYGSNLIYSLPEPEKTIKAIDQLDLMIAVDTMPAEICGWADVVLPECTYVERYDDLRISPGRKPQIALRAPAFEPANNTKPSAWMVKRLAPLLGLEDYFPWDTMEEYLDVRLKGIGSSLEEMERVGVKTFPQAGSHYLAPGEEVTFNTPSGKIELYSAQLEAAGFDPIPRYRAHPEPPGGFYRLLQGRAPAHTFARTSNNPLLNELMSENDLWINPDTAAEWAIESGQYLYLINDEGKHSSFPIRARVTQRIRRDCVYMVHGFGHQEKQLSRAFGRGADDNEMLTSVAIDPIMGGTSRRTTFVTFERVETEVA
jgi:thiosulfate reductase / polysulfide reductase chain A